MKFENKVSLKTYLLTIALVSVIFLSAIAYVASQGVSEPNIYLDSLPSTASYVISTDGTYYYATRYDGYLAYGGPNNRGAVSGTNASAVIQAAINALGTAGGKIFIKGGTYIINTKLNNTRYGLTIEGEGPGTSILHGVTILKLGNNVNDYIFYNNFGHNLILRNILFDGNKDNNPTGKGLYLLGDDLNLENIAVLHSGGTGIEGEPRASFFKNVYVELCNGTGFFFYPVTVDQPFNNVFINLYSFGNDKGFVIQKGNRNVFIGCVADKNQRDGFVLEGSSDNRFVGCIAYNNSQAADNTYDAFRLESYGGVNSLRNVFDNPVIYSPNAATRHRYGIYEVDANQDYNVYLAATFYQVGTAIVKSGAHSIIKCSPNYVTENSGTATVANGEWISHGLAGTPTTVTVTPTTLTYGTPPVPVVVGVVARNSTMFQVGCYWTNGTAITNDAIVIDWYAEYKP